MSDEENTEEFLEFVHAPMEDLQPVSPESEEATASFRTNNLIGLTPVGGSEEE